MILLTRMWFVKTRTKGNGEESNFLFSEVRVFANPVVRMVWLTRGWFVSSRTKGAENRTVENKLFQR